MDWRQTTINNRAKTKSANNAVKNLWQGWRDQGKTEWKRPRTEAYGRTVGGIWPEKRKWGCRPGLEITKVQTRKWRRRRRRHRKRFLVRLRIRDFQTEKYISMRRRRWRRWRRRWNVSPFAEIQVDIGSQGRLPERVWSLDHGHLLQFPQGTRGSS